MKAILSIALALAASIAVSAQTAPLDLSAARTSPERKAILDALRTTLSKELGQDVSFVVEWLKVKDGYAYFHGAVKRKDGRAIAFEKIQAYRELVRDGVFDGDGTAALLRKTGGRWRPITHVIGPTDVAWACWWKEYRAPRAVFDYAEDCP